MPQKGLPSPLPGDDSDDDLPRRPGIPTFTDAVRLWRDAGARRHGETPGAILASAIECVKYVDASAQAHIWISAARVVHDEGGLDDDTAHCAIWKVAVTEADHCEEHNDGVLGVLRRAGADGLARLVAQDVIAFEQRMARAEVRIADELRSAREWRDRAWAPPGKDRTCTRHEVFLDALAATEDGSPECTAATAGLLALQFYDEYSKTGPAIASPDSAAMTNVRKTVARLPRENALRVALVRLVNRVQRTPQDGNEWAPGDLFAIAQAYRARGSGLLAADICHTIVQGWAEMDDGELSRPARRMLKEIEGELADSR
jgi:hypothetical protein